MAKELMHEDDYNAGLNAWCKKKKCKHIETRWIRQKKTLKQMMNFPTNISKRFVCDHCGKLIGSGKYAYACQKCKWAWVCQDCSRILNRSRKGDNYIDKPGYIG